MTKNKITIGVLALQGAYIEHVEFLKRCVQFKEQKKVTQFEFDVIEVRTAAELKKCDALVIPGGESTSISLIARRVGIFDDLVEFVHDENKAIWGTCAGLIFLAKIVENKNHDGEILETLQLADIGVVRNAFGRQSQSFIKPCDFSSFIQDCNDFETVFIRAPVISRVLNEKTVKILFSLPYPDAANGVQELIVAAKQNDNVLLTSFHPELSNDVRFHNYFIEEFVLKKYLA